MIITFACSFLAFAPICVNAEDGYGDPGASWDNPFDTPKDDWSKRFNDSISNDDRVKTEKPRQNNQLDNEWRKPRQKRQSISDIHSKQFQQRRDD